MDVGRIMRKAKQLVDDNPDKVAAGVDKVGELVDKGTRGKLSGPIAKGRELAKGALVHDREAAGSPSNAAEAEALDEEVRPTTGEAFESTTVAAESRRRGRSPGQVS